MERREIVQQRREIFADRRVNVHSPGDDAIGLARRHDVEEGVHDLVAVDPEYRRAQDPLAFPRRRPPS